MKSGSKSGGMRKPGNGTERKNNIRINTMLHQKEQNLEKRRKEETEV